jgi:predicted RNase H-like HicB family nuclease
MTTHLDHSTVITRDRLGNGTECFVAHDPALPGCVSYGKTPAEAAEQLEDARQVYLRARDGSS